jgi:hypothetical protein
MVLEKKSKMRKFRQTNHRHLVIRKFENLLDGNTSKFKQSTTSDMHFICDTQVNVNARKPLFETGLLIKIFKIVILMETLIKLEEYKVIYSTYNIFSMKCKFKIHQPSEISLTFCASSAQIFEMINNLFK